MSTSIDRPPMVIPRPRGGVANFALAAGACFAVLLPTLIAFNVPPSATFFNQAAAFIGWGGFLLTIVTTLRSDDLPRGAGSLALISALGILVVAAAGAAVVVGRPWSLSLVGGRHDAQRGPRRCRGRQPHPGRAGRAGVSRFLHRAGSCRGGKQPDRTGAGLRSGAGPMATGSRLPRSRVARPATSGSRIISAASFSGRSSR